MFWVIGYRIYGFSVCWTLVQWAIIDIEPLPGVMSLEPDPSGKTGPHLPLNKQSFSAKSATSTADLPGIFSFEILYWLFCHFALNRWARRAPLLILAGRWEYGGQSSLSPNVGTSLASAGVFLCPLTLKSLVSLTILHSSYIQLFLHHVHEGGDRTIQISLLFHNLNIFGQCTFCWDAMAYLRSTGFLSDKSSTSFIIKSGWSCCLAVLFSVFSFSWMFSHFWQQQTLRSIAFKCRTFCGLCFMKLT